MPESPARIITATRPRAQPGLRIPGRLGSSNSLLRTQTLIQRGLPGVEDCAGAGAECTIGAERIMGGADCTGMGAGCTAGAGGGVYCGLGGGFIVTCGRTAGAGVGGILVG